jgi:subfamily B ATP-binding cassette protein MsbA
MKGKPHGDSSLARSEGARARSWEDFFRLLSYVRPYGGTLLLALFLMNAVALLEGALRSLLVPISDGLLASGGVLASAPRAKNLVDFHRYLPLESEQGWYWLAALMILITLAKGVAEFSSHYLMARIGQRAVFDLRCALYDHLLRQSAPFFSRHPTNVLTAHLVNDVEKIEMAVSRTLADALRESFTLIVFLVIVFKLNWKLALLALGLGPLVVHATVYFGRHLRRTGRRVQEGYEQILNVAQETLSGNLVVKAFGTEAVESERFRRAAHAVMRAVLKAARTAALSPPLIELMGIIAASGFILYAQRIIARREMTPGEFFVFLFFLFSLYDPVRKLSRIQNAMQHALAACRRIFTLLDTHTELVDRPHAIALATFRDKIEFRNVSFRYPDAEDYILRNVNLTIRAGEMVAIVGMSGVGKTTLVKLLPRFYDVTEGAILIDGVDIRDLRVESLRRLIAVVTQDVILFNDTIRHNIAYGRPQATPEEIERAARAALAHEFIQELPRQYETVIGERGVRLSGGERQRIAIARAILKDAPILILDEATSALDAESEHGVQQALLNLMAGRTVIVIAHRLSTIRRADRIVVLDGGTVVEEGTHADLLRQGGVYSRLYERQFADQASEVLSR